MSLDRDRQFENQLRKAQPLQPRDGLAGDIGHALREAGRRRHMRQWRALMAWGGLAVAASVILTFGILLFNGRFSLAAPTPELPSRQAVAADPGPGQADDFRPVLAENNLKSRIDEGIVFLRNGLTARRYRYEFIDRVVWENPADGAVVEMQIPREEVVLVPVQTF
jgi:hypothetical protein